MKERSPIFSASFIAGFKKYLQENEAANKHLRTGQVFYRYAGLNEVWILSDTIYESDGEEFEKIINSLTDHSQ